MKRIESRQNPKIKLTRSLEKRKTREAEGLFLVEGLFHIGEGLEAGAKFEYALAAPEQIRNEFGEQLLDKLGAAGVDLYELPGELLSELSGREKSSGLLAVCRENYQALRELDANGIKSLVGIVEAADPGNVGAVLRSLDAFGVDGLLMLDGGVDAYHPSAVRAGMGAHFRKHIVIASFAECVSWAKANGFALVGSSAKDGVALSEAHVPHPFILLLGSEREGLSMEQKAACDQLLRIEMRGRATSLNLAVAGGILLNSLMN